MAGIYIHIPFCKQACYYCDFHFSTSLKYKQEMLEAINKEITLQPNFLGTETIETIYLGSSTPSLLSASEINTLIENIHKNFSVADECEVTLETNPDDLSFEKIQELKQTEVNRFSIGIQSFYDEDLQWMNRAHRSEQGKYAIQASQDAGFSNITVDLIYGYPLLSDEKWQTNMKQLLDFRIPHISCYSMTVETKTALASFINKGKEKNMDDAQSARQFIQLINTLTQNGYQHYEISNFAFHGQYSKHNTNYWKGIKYLGLGPSAHSFSGINRQWNIANNSHYLSALAENKIPAEKEILSNKDRINEYIMTSLRTCWGLDLSKIEADYGQDIATELKNQSAYFFDKGWLEEKSTNYILTTEGKLYADHIAAELFIEDEF